MQRFIVLASLVSELAGLSNKKHLSPLRVNNRIIEFVYTNHLIKFNQIGFRKGYRTADHVFVMKTLIDNYLNKSKKLYCLTSVLFNLFINDIVDSVGNCQNNLYSPGKLNNISIK